MEKSPIQELVDQRKIYLQTLSESQLKEYCLSKLNQTHELLVKELFAEFITNSQEHKNLYQLAKSLAFPNDGTSDIKKYLQQRFIILGENPMRNFAQEPDAEHYSREEITKFFYAVHPDVEHAEWDVICKFFAENYGCELQQLTN